MYACATHADLGHDVTDTDRQTQHGALTAVLSRLSNENFNKLYL